MTLILARASAEFVLQVTDRLVTLTTTKKPHDRVANKNILYFTSNAVVAIAYTGHAYLDGIPTDHWIAQKLAGIKIDPESPTMLMGSRNNLKQDVGLAFQSLRNELDGENQRSSLDLLISIQGWQWDSKGRLRPIVGDIRKASPEKVFSIYYEPRNWYSEGASMTIAAPSANISQEELTDLSNRLRYKSATEVEGLLVDKIRELSQRLSIIGPHCISILLPPPSNPNISVRYHPANPSTIPELQRLTDVQEFWAYSPWIVSPRMCLPPAQITGGGFTARTGLFSIYFASQTPQHPDWLLAHFGQKRHNRP